MPEKASTKRRQILSGLMKLLVLIGFVFLSIPFVSTFSTRDINEKQNSSTQWVVTTAISDLVEGEVKALNWSGGLFWVYARSKKDIQSLQKENKFLTDPLSTKSDQPDVLKTNFRSGNEKYFVFVPHENKRNCQVRLSDEEEYVFIEPCFNAKYDAAGRILKNSGHKQQQNLAVPENVIEDGILKIGIWMPKK